MERNIYFDGKKVPLTEVAEHGEKKLFRYEKNAYIKGLSENEIKEMFPNYNFEPYELLHYDFTTGENNGISFVEL